MIKNSDFLHSAIINLDTTIVSVQVNSLDNIICLDKDGGSVAINEDDVNTETDRLQAEYDALAWKRSRQAEYPDWGSQLNKIYDDGVTKWKSEMVDPIKAKWPKDNSGPV